MTEVIEESWRETVHTKVFNPKTGMISRRTEVIVHPAIGHTEHSIGLAEYILKHVELDENRQTVVRRLIDEHVSPQFIFGVLGEDVAPSVLLARNQWRMDDMEPRRYQRIRHDDVVRYEGMVVMEDRLENGD